MYKGLEERLDEGRARRAADAARIVTGRPEPVAGDRGVARCPRPALRSAPTSIPRLCLVLFPLALVIPWMIDVAGTRLSVYRILLLVGLGPCLWVWASGRAGRVRTPDVLLLGFCGWAGLGLVAAHGAAGAVEPTGVLLVETLGPYLLARCCVRSADDFRTMVKALFGLVLLLLPFALYESATGAKPLLEWFGTVFPTIEPTLMTPRLGFWRVQGPFEHSILFGINCGCILALVFLVLGDGRSFARRCWQAGVVVLTASLSLSSGAITGMAAQALLLSWGWMFSKVEARWRLLVGLMAVFYLFIVFASNQSVPAFYISRFSFDQQSAGFRLLIWDHASASVLAHPWLGIGLGDWLRPSWMPPSIDMFWLVNAVRYGLPGGLLMIGAVLATFVALAFKKGLSAREAAGRDAWMFAITGFCLVGWTVHFWNSTYVLFLFLLGSGMWLLDAASDEVAPAERGSPGQRIAARISAPAASRPRSTAV